MPAVATAAGLPSRLGKYELLLPLAAGGMARIYIGRSTGIGSFERHVVLKLITPERANDESAVQMFLDEARLAASLNHQNVAQVFEVGEDVGIHYLAMEYVHGQDLRAVLAKAGSQGTRIPLELALTVVAGAAAGLNHAHERRGPDGLPLGIVHRDVSPSNLMIGYDGSVKLLDFGIAKATARTVETQSGIIKGKFAYMAPEQCRGRDVDRRSDVFSLGIILYEVTTQHRCFRADSDFDTMHRIVTGDVVRPTRLVQGYPQALEAVVMKALAVDAAQRYQSAGMLLEAIEAFAMSSRMNLSTMGLGRFMRDMFGEVVEPWLNRTSQPVIQKENTISSTNNSGSSAMGQGQGDVSTGAPPPEDQNGDDEERFPDSDGMQAAKTILDLPRGAGRETESPSGEWEHRTVQPGHAHTGPELVRPSYPAIQPTPAAQFRAMPTQPPMQSTLQAALGPPTLSGQTMPAIPSTRHGYASGNEMSYPRYERPVAPIDIPKLKVNRLPLVIGIALVAAMLVIVLIKMRSGASDVPPVDQMQSTTPPGEGSAKPDESEDMIQVKIDSTPHGADVLVAGTKIGVTPLDKKLKRGTKAVPLTVHLVGFDDVTSKIDLGGDVTRTIPLKPTDLVLDPGSGSSAPNAAPPPTPPAPPAHSEAAPTSPSPSPSPAPVPPAPVDHKAPTPPPAHPPVVDHRPVRPVPDHKLPVPEHKAPEPTKPHCQPPSAFNPFDTSCNGNPCPPCK